ncbi:hypothetical protein GCM10023172_14920 [Hymenobacter ginsengisoli]|uniref:Uncharacterized protein n=1 Tax=Hymenobacter ginsengisoli TaxID=1051626 RepID=A0ABP8Q5W5_9BACT|nr:MULTISPECIES: hypothetical protein [unclassified Hymenobacter]MBO2030958.1 hypothetical protein [Hymenobacter sp. BT559]
MQLALSLRTLSWALLASCWLGASCSGAHEPTQATKTAVHADIAATANVPALVGLTIDDLHMRLGSRQPLPAGFLTPAAQGVPEAASQLVNRDSLASFQAGGLTLLANYNAQTRRVHELVVLGHYEDSLMAKATLRTSASHYLVLPLFANDRPNYLLGLRVVPVN